MTARAHLLSIALFASTGCIHLRWSPDAIAGAWQSPCLPARAEIGFAQASVDERQTFAQGEVQIEQRFYSDAACKDPYFRRTVVAQYAVGGARLDPVGARDLELTTLQATARPEVEKAASNLSEQFYCGRADWALGASADILGRSCNGVPTPAAGAEVHQIAQVDGDSLYLGSASSGDGSTPARRPSVLSTTAYRRAK